MKYMLISFCVFAILVIALTPNNDAGEPETLLPVSSSQVIYLSSQSAYFSSENTYLYGIYYRNNPERWKLDSIETLKYFPKPPPPKWGN